MQQVQEQGDCLQLNHKLCFENNGLNRGLGSSFDSFYSFFITNSNCKHKMQKIEHFKTK